MSHNTNDLRQAVELTDLDTLADRILLGKIFLCENLVDHNDERGLLAILGGEESPTPQRNSEQARAKDILENFAKALTLDISSARFILDQQLPEGGWNNYPDGPADLSVSVKAYFALKLAGHNPDAPHMRRACEVIRGLGGAAHHQMERLGGSPDCGPRWASRCRPGPPS